jgi:hypothetical protein
MTEDELSKQVLAQYAEGVTVKDILLNNNIDYRRFRRIRNKAGVIARVGGSLKWILPLSVQEEVCLAYKTGESIRSLALKHKVDRSVINGILDRFGIQKRSIKESNVKKSFPEEDICAYFKESSSMNATARKFGTTTLTISRILERRGIRIRLIGASRPSDLTEHKQRILDLYNDGWSISKIRNEIGVNTNTTNYTRLLKNSGVKIRSRGEQNAIYSVDDDYFAKIDNPMKAYLLGLIYTDGAVRTRPKKKFLLELHKNDEQTIQLAKKEIGYTGPLYYTDKNSVILSVHNPRLVDDLVSLGVVHNKTKVLTYPTWLTPELTPHFLHGVLDGDGWASLSDNGSVSVGICSGSKDFFDGLCDALVSYNIQFRVVVTEEQNYRFEITLGNDRIRFLNLLFKDAPAIMKRKFLGFENILNRPLRKYVIDDRVMCEAQSICQDIRTRFHTILCESSVS